MSKPVWAAVGVALAAAIGVLGGRHTSRPDVVSRVETANCIRFDLGDDSLTADVVASDGSTDTRQFRITGGLDGDERGTLVVIPDATDDTMRVVQTITRRPSFTRRADVNVVRIDLSVHVNPAGHYPTPGNPNVWVQERRVKRERGRHEKPGPLF